MPATAQTSPAPPLGEVEVLVRATPYLSDHIIMWRIERHLEREPGAPLWAMPDGSFQPGDTVFVMCSAQGFPRAVDAVKWAEQHGWIVIALIPLS